jgi:peptidoglycan hydrolase CwlO-like protein
MMARAWYETFDWAALASGLGFLIATILYQFVQLHKKNISERETSRLVDKHLNNSDVPMREEINEKLDRICTKQEELTDDVKEVKQDIGSVDRRIGHLDDRIISLDKRVQRVEEHRPGVIPGLDPESLKGGTKLHNVRKI